MSSNTASHAQISFVSNFSELISTKFHAEKNAACWHRQLAGDFQEIVNKLELKDDITEITTDDLLALHLSEHGVLARNTILQDMQLLTDCGALPVLNLLKQYERDEDFDFISTDVYSYHVDRSPIETSTFLCTYVGACSDILANHQAEQKILIPEIRAQLKKLYDGPEAGFDQFLEEYFFDLHYQAKAGAQPINLGQGHLWRLAVDHPGQQSLPCIHRAPKEQHGEYRLLLIC